jgi:hypothetical protein
MFQSEAFRYAASFVFRRNPQQAIIPASFRLCYRLILALLPWGRLVRYERAGSFLLWLISIDRCTSFRLPDPYCECMKDLHLLIRGHFLLSQVVTQHTACIRTGIILLLLKAITDLSILMFKTLTGNVRQKSLQITEVNATRYAHIPTFPGRLTVSITVGANLQIGQIFFSQSLSIPLMRYTTSFVLRLLSSSFLTLLKTSLWPIPSNWRFSHGLCYLWSW